MSEYEYNIHFTGIGLIVALSVFFAFGLIVGVML